jgi:hypothetical protein
MTASMVAPRASWRAADGDTFALTRSRVASCTTSSGMPGDAKLPGSTMRRTMVPANGAGDDRVRTHGSQLRRPRAGDPPRPAPGQTRLRRVELRPRRRVVGVERAHALRVQLRLTQHRLRLGTARRDLRLLRRQVARIDAQQWLAGAHPVALLHQHCRDGAHQLRAQRRLRHGSRHTRRRLAHRPRRERHLVQHFVRRRRTGRRLRVLAAAPRTPRRRASRQRAAHHSVALSSVDHPVQ